MHQNPSPWQRFVVGRGERAGLAVCGLIALVMLASGGRLALSVDRPSATAAAIQTRAADIVARLHNDAPPPETAAAVHAPLSDDPPPLHTNLIGVGTDWFDRHRNADHGRLSPRLLAPTEFQSDVVRGLVRVGGKPVETVEPVRLAVIHAAFPYQRQLEAYRTALRTPQLAAEDLPRFLPFQVRRRTLDDAGRVREDWEDLNLLEYGQLLERAAGIEPDPPGLKPVLVGGLVMRRPVLAHGTYPAARLPALDAALRKLKEQEAFTPETPALPTAAPEFCLLRLCDPTVQPGKTYEYQVRIRVANPNFQKEDLVAYPSLATAAELVGPWSPAARVRVSAESFVYATGLKTDANTALVHLQQWHARVRLAPGREATPVGLWCPADVPVRRGETIGSVQRIEVPVWFAARAAFGLAPPLQPNKKGVPVDFRTNDLLVDWEGGKLARDAGDADMELLVLGADGKLRVHRSDRDARDSGRAQRAAEYRKLVEQARDSGMK